jgi:hypothetical protein
MCKAEEMTPITMTVASKVSEAENGKLLGCGPGIQTLGTTPFDDCLTTNELVEVFALQTGECIGLLGVTLEDITLDSPGDTEPSAGHNEQRAADIVTAEEPLRGDSWMTAAGTSRPDRSDGMAELGSCVGEPLMTRPSGYSLPPLPSIQASLVNIDRSVQIYS